MRFMAVLFSLMLATSTFAETKILRNNDGMDARCSVKADVGRRSYSLSLVSEKIEGDTRTVSLKVNFKKCAEVENGFAQQDSSADEILHSYIVMKDGTLGQTDNKLVAVEFSLVKADGVKLNTLSVNAADQDEDDFIVDVKVNKNFAKVYVLAVLTSNISSSESSIEGLEQRYGGYVLSFE